MGFLAASCGRQATNSESTLVRIQHLEDERATTSKQLKHILDQLKDLSSKVEKMTTTVQSLRDRPKPRHRPVVKRPDPQTVYSVPIAGNAYTGPKYAKVTLVKAFEFACGFSHRVRPTIAQLRKDYGKDLKIVYKNYIVHPNTATIPAQAACAAHKQGKFMKMHNLIWKKGFEKRQFGADTMEKLARNLRLNMRRFRADMNGAECTHMVQNDMRQLAAVGTRGTPMFYINGRFLSGARPIGQFKTIIDQELKKATAAIRRGTSLKNYYQEYVVKNGKSAL